MNTLRSGIDIVAGACLTAVPQRWTPSLQTSGINSQLMLQKLAFSRPVVCNEIDLLTERQRVEVRGVGRRSGIPH